MDTPIKPRPPVDGLTVARSLGRIFDHSQAGHIRIKHFRLTKAQFEAVIPYFRPIGGEVCFAIPSSLYGYDIVVTA